MLKEIWTPRLSKERKGGHSRRRAQWCFLCRAPKRCVLYRCLSVSGIVLQLMWCVIVCFSISEDARKALASFGSAYISALAFRDVWAFVGRPNLKGFTLYEDVCMLLNTVSRLSGSFVVFLVFCLKFYHDKIVIQTKFDLSPIAYSPIPVCSKALIFIGCITLYCIAFIRFYSASRSAPQSEALPVWETNAIFQALQHPTEPSTNS